MSFLVNLVIKSPFQLAFRRFTPVAGIHTTAVQQLYSQSALGIDTYLNARKRTKEQLSGYNDKFKVKMADFVQNEKNMIFSEDLKNMVHLAEPTDLPLVVQMIQKFNLQATEFRFGSFVFGPVVMRMFYFLDAPEEALKCFQDPGNEKFFDQQISYQILLDLLYNNGMYDEMFAVFEKIQQKQLNMTKHPKYCVVLVLAACYKQNTPKSLEYASKLWSAMTSSGTNPLRRAAGLIAGLALKQGAPHIALEVITQQRQHYVTIRNIKAQALSAAGRVEDALPVLRSVLDIDRPDQQGKHTFFHETVAVVREAVEKSNNEDTKREFEAIEKGLKERNLIDPQTLDQLLSSDITSSRNTQQDGNTSRIQRPRLNYTQRNTYVS